MNDNTKTIEIYDSLPEGCIQAKFGHVADVNEFDKWISKPGVEFYVQSFHTDKYEIYTTTEWSNIEEIMVFIKTGRCFIDPNPKPKEKKVKKFKDIPYNKELLDF